jgi:cytochrome c oxidase subunit 2
VSTLVLFSAWKFRMRPGEELKDGPPIHGNTRLEVIWTAFPAVLLISLCSYAYVVLRDVERKPSGTRELEVNVTSQQFAWSFQYPSSVTGGAPMDSTELYLPRGQSIRFHVSSKDVIHAFFVPAFRLQIDAVPGQTTNVRATPTQVGDYPLVCAELCGLGHSSMRSTVHVVSPAVFARWLKGRQTPVVSPSASPAQTAAAGKRVFVGNGGCGACHTLADAGTNGTVGPNLDRYLKGKSPAFIRRKILEPSSFTEKGFPAGVMPTNFGSTLSKSEIDALVAYLAGATGK